MTVKEYLLQLRALDARIRNKREQAETLKTMLGGRAVAYDGDKVQTSPGNTTENLVVRLMEAQQEVDDETMAYIDQYETIVNQINGLSDDRYIQILNLHYVPNAYHQTQRLEDISCIMKKRDGSPYSYDHISRLHGYALQAFYKRYGEELGLEKKPKKSVEQHGNADIPMVK